MIEHLVLPNNDGTDDSVIVEEATRGDGAEGVRLRWSKAGTFLTNADCELLSAWLQKRSREQQHAKTTEWVKNNLSSKTQRTDEELELRAEQSGLSSYDEEVAMIERELRD